MIRCNYDEQSAIPFTKSAMFIADTVLHGDARWNLRRPFFGGSDSAMAISLLKEFHCLQLENGTSDVGNSIKPTNDATFFTTVRRKISDNFVSFRSSCP